MLNISYRKCQASLCFCLNFICNFKSSDPCLIGQATCVYLQTIPLHVLSKSYLPWYIPMVLFACSPAHLNISLPRLIRPVPCTRLLHQTLAGDAWFSLFNTLVSIRCPQLMHLLLLLVVMTDILHCLHPIGGQLLSPEWSIAQWKHVSVG